MVVTSASVYPLLPAVPVPARLPPSPAGTQAAEPISSHPFSTTHYSPTKFLALQSYCATASRWRVAAVLVFTPIPALIGSLLPSLAPLQNPLLGQQAVPATVLHGWIMMFLISFGVILLTLGATATPRSLYSEWEAAVVALVTSAMISVFEFLLLTYWRSPPLFGIFVTAVPWVLSLLLAHAVLLRRKFQKYPQLLPSLKRYLVPLQLQTSQFGIYIGLSVLFDHVDTVYQVSMVVIFPLVKFLLKRLMRKSTQSLGEMSSEVSLSAIEISASLYQSMIMQTTPSTLALCLIMGVDLVQGVVSIKYFMGRHLRTPRQELFERATEILSRQPPLEPLLDGQPKQQPWSEEDVVVVTEALEVATAVDGVLLVEYLECSVPIVNALFLVLTYHAPSTKYNTRLFRFYDNSALVASSTASVLLYSALQGLSLVIMHFVLQTRHKCSGFHHLAFVLEYHARSIQGKLVAFFPLVFYFTLIHYGADFTLRFDFAALLAEMTGASSPTT